MKNIKQSLLDFLAFWNYTPKSIKCARIIVHNTRRIELKVNYTNDQLDDFLAELDFNIELNIEVIRAYIWMIDGTFAEVDQGIDIAQWKHIYIPKIPNDLIA